MTRTVIAIRPGAAELDDLEMMVRGGYDRVRSFLPAAASAGIAERGRLPSGERWPVDVSLTLPDDADHPGIECGDVGLLDEENVPLARIEGARFERSRGRTRVSGDVIPEAPPERGCFPELRLDAAAARAHGGGRAVLGLPVVRPVTPADAVAAAETAGDLGADLLYLPCTGTGSSPWVTPAVLVRSCLEAAERTGGRVVPVAVPRRGGWERHRVLRALVSRAYGATHVVLGLAPDPELPAPVRLPAVAFDRRRDAWLPAGDVAEPDVVLRGEDVPDELAARSGAGPAPPVHVTGAALARSTTPGERLRGGVVFFSGLSGSGKSTLARALADRIRADTGRPVTLLDGDRVRASLSSGLGFSRADRETNIRRIGFVAAEIARHGGIALCAPIAPFAATRAEVRREVEQVGWFCLVHVSTPLEVCERRDRKGMYARARAGAIGEFTGISSPYEEPDDAEVTLSTDAATPGEGVEEVLATVRSRGWLTADPSEEELP